MHSRNDGSKNNEPKNQETQCDKSLSEKILFSNLDIVCKMVHVELQLKISYQMHLVALTNKAPSTKDP